MESQGFQYIENFIIVQISMSKMIEVKEQTTSGRVEKNHGLREFFRPAAG